MKNLAIIGAAVAAAAGAVWFTWGARQVQPTTPLTSPPAAARQDHTPAGADAAPPASSEQSDGRTSPHSRALAAPSVQDPIAANRPTDPRAAARAKRPLPPSPAEPAKEPEPEEQLIPHRMARLALSRVGADPDAEIIWSLAINDPSVSAHDRSDLIEDLNEEGFPDPDHVTKDDLPLIKGRLAIIVKHAPDAMDDVNAAAFAEAYKDLVNMLTSLNGK